MLGWHVVSVVLPAPDRYPDFYPLILSVFCFVQLLGFFIYFIVAQFKVMSPYQQPKIKAQ
jgi:hypothetical protein